MTFPTLLKPELTQTHHFLLQDRVEAVTRRLNRVLAVTDGDTTTTMTVFEGRADTVVAGNTYVVRNYRVGTRGAQPSLQGWADTRFYATAPVLVSAQLEERANLLVFPASPRVPANQLDQAHGLVTLQGIVHSVSNTD